MAIDPGYAGMIQKSLELFHIVSYFSPEVAAAYQELGSTNMREAYFASRVAPIGQVGPEIVYATFYSFALEEIRKNFAHPWDIASPQDWIAARYAGTRTALASLGIDATVIDRLAEILKPIAQSINDFGGRTLAAGYLGLPWPEDPLMIVWHAQTILREFRGDGHIMVLASVGLTGLEAVMMHVASGKGFTEAAARNMRGYTEQEWAEADANLIASKLFSKSMTLSEEGIALRETIEKHTDTLGYEPWKSVSEATCQEILQLAEPINTKLLESGRLSPQVFSFLK